MPIRIPAILALLVLAASTPAQAQFGGFLKDLRGAAEKLKEVQADPGTVAPAGPGGAPAAKVLGMPGGDGLLSAPQYCQKVAASPAVQEFVRQLRRAGQEKAIGDDAFMRLGRQSLDSAQGELTQWVTQQVRRRARDMVEEAQLLDRLEAVAASCALTHVDSDLFLFFAFNPVDKAVVDAQRDRVRNQARGALGYGGSDNIRGSRGPRDALFSSRWASVLAFLFEGGDAAAEKTAAGLGANFDAWYARRNADAQRAEVARSQEEARRRKEAAEQQAEADRQRAYAESPEGRLFASYKWYQLVDACQKISMLYVSGNEMSEARTKMKEIDSRLKPRVKSGDDIWAQAVKDNQNHGPLKIDLFTNLKLLRAGEALSECKDIKNQFILASQDVLGKDVPVKKNF